MAVPIPGFRSQFLRRIREVFSSSTQKPAHFPRNPLLSIDAHPPNPRDILTALEPTLGLLPAQALTAKLMNVLAVEHSLRHRATRVTSGPLNFYIDPSNSCNLACPGCVHSTNPRGQEWFVWPKGNIRPELFDRFLHRYAASALIAIFYNYGEPLVNRDTPLLIRRCKEHLLQTVLSTNLSLPNFDAEAYVNSGLDYMILSIDGVTQAVYERFRRRGKLDLVIENVRKLVNARRQNGRSTPLITWQFIAFEHSVHELSAALAQARELGLDHFEAIPALDVSWDDPSVRAIPFTHQRVAFSTDHHARLSANWNPFPETLNASAIERAFNTVHDWTSSTDPPAPTPTCEWLYKTMSMDATGRIFPCASAPTPSRHLTFANLETTQDPFNSTLYQIAREFNAIRRTPAATLEPSPYCVQCEFNRKSIPNTDQINNYFVIAAPGFFHPADLDRLSRWADRP